MAQSEDGDLALRDTCRVHGLDSTTPWGSGVAREPDPY